MKRRSGVGFTTSGDKFRFRCYQLGTDEVFSCRPGMRRAYLGTIELLATGRKLARTLAGRIVGPKEGFTTRLDAAEALLEDFSPPKKSYDNCHRSTNRKRKTPGLGAGGG